MRNQETVERELIGICEKWFMGYRVLCASPENYTKHRENENISICLLVMVGKRV